MELNAITLENGEKYVIANQVNFEGKLYLQIAKVDNAEDFAIVEKINDELILIEDEILIAKVLKKIIENLL